MHIIMECTDLNECRNRLWDDITDSLGVVHSVDLWSKCDLDILTIMLGAYRAPLRDPLIRYDVCAVLVRYVDIHTYIHTYMHTYIHTYIHTYKRRAFQNMKEHDVVQRSASRTMCNDFCVSMGDRLYKHSFPYYTASMQNI